MQKVAAKSTARFGGSAWVNLDIAQRNIELAINVGISSIDIPAIEFHILRALYERDGQHASELAQAVGRAATSFTPNLDKLEKRGFVERRPDPNDRRAVRIFLTAQATEQRKRFLGIAEGLDTEINRLFDPADYEAFLRVLVGLQNVEPHTLGL